MDWSYIGMMISSGERFSVKDEDDILKINFNSASFVDVLDTLVQYTKQKRTYLCPTYDGKFSEDAFRNDNALMIMQVTAHVRNSRDMESDFAVLPMPKYSEAQDHYYSYCPRVTYVGVPSTILETEYVGGILEALTAKSSEIVIPEYLNIALSERFMRDGRLQAHGRIYFRPYRIRSAGIDALLGYRVRSLHEYGQIKKQHGCEHL